MADTKLTALADLAAPLLTDIMYIVDDPGGTPISKKATLANLRAVGVAYGDLYVSGGVTAQSLTAATPAKMTMFTADGPASNTTPAHASDQITVDIAGVYKIAAHFSMTSSVNNVVVDFTVAIGGVAQTIKTSRKIGTGTDVGATGLIGHLSLSASDIVTIIVESDGNTNLTVTEGQLVVGKVS